MPTEEQQQQQAEERHEGASGRFYWLVLKSDGSTRLVASQGEHEMGQLSDLLGGGAFSQIPTTKLSEHKLAVCYKSVAVTDETRNNAASAWLGVTITGDCVIAQRRDSEAVFNSPPRVGRRYVKPMLRAEANEVAGKIKSGSK